jgi:hypothetical protein
VRGGELFSRLLDRRSGAEGGFLALALGELGRTSALYVGGAFPNFGAVVLALSLP